LLDGHSIHKSGRFQTYINQLEGFKIFLFTPYCSFLNPSEYTFAAIKYHYRRKNNYGDIDCMNACGKSVKNLTKTEIDFCWIYAAKNWLIYFDELIKFFKEN
jgi:transposase